MLVARLPQDGLIHVPGSLGTPGAEDVHQVSFAPHFRHTQPWLPIIRGAPWCATSVHQNRCHRWRIAQEMVTGPSYLNGTSSSSSLSTVSFRTRRGAQYRVVSSTGPGTPTGTQAPGASRRSAQAFSDSRSSFASRRHLSSSASVILTCIPFMVPNWYHNGTTGCKSHFGTIMGLGTALVSGTIMGPSTQGIFERTVGITTPFDRPPLGGGGQRPSTCYIPSSINYMHHHHALLAPTH